MFKGDLASGEDICGGIWSEKQEEEEEESLFGIIREEEGVGSRGGVSGLKTLACASKVQRQAQGKVESKGARP